MAKKTKQDPTGQRVNRAKAAKSIVVRLDAAEKRVKSLFRIIPKQRRSEKPIVNKTIFDYDITAQQREYLEQEIKRALDEELETEQDRRPFSWWYESSLELPFRQGTVEEIVQFNQLVQGAIIAGALVNGMPPRKFPTETVLQSQPYLQALNSVYVEGYADIKGLSNKTSALVFQQINNGLSSKLAPREISEKIAQRFRVARSDAKRIAVTEVNKAYNDARLEASNIAANETGLRAGVIHISALMPTTRDDHANRHGNAYTVEDQREWWNTGANRINCHCTTETVLIDNQGRVVQKEKQEALKDERKFFDKAS